MPVLGNVSKIGLEDIEPPLENVNGLTAFMIMACQTMLNVLKNKKME